MDTAQLEVVVNALKKEIEELKVAVKWLKSDVLHLKGDINTIVEGGKPDYYE